MSAEIGPGDWVERCSTEGCSSANSYLDLVPLRSIHQVEAVTAVRDIPCLVLCGVAHPRGYRAVRADNFRPIYRPKSDLLEKLKQPAPEREFEAAMLGDDAQTACATGRTGVVPG